jgi:hypothetical protein
MPVKLGKQAKNEEKCYGDAIRRQAALVSLLVSMRKRAHSSPDRPALPTGSRPTLGIRSLCHPHFFLALPWTALHNAAHRVSE